MLYATRFEVILFDWLVFASIVVMVAGFICTYRQQRKELNLLREQNEQIVGNNSSLREQNDLLLQSQRQLPMPSAHPVPSSQPEPEWVKELYQDMNEDEVYEQMAQDAIDYVENLYKPFKGQG